MQEQRKHRFGRHREAEGRERRRWPRHEQRHDPRDDPYYGGYISQRYDWPARANDNSLFDRPEGNYQAGGNDFREKMHEDWTGYGRDPGEQVSFESRGAGWDHEQPPRGGMWRKVKNFFGIGPKGYKRSDERIREDVCEALAAHSEVNASDIEVFVKEGEVTLRGTVESRWMKRQAEDALAHVPGVADVHVELGISSPNLRHAPSSPDPRDEDRSAIH